MCGYLVNVMYGTRQAASAWQSEVGKAMCDINMNPGRASPCVLHQSEVDGTGLVLGDDLVIVTSRRHSKQRIRASLAQQMGSGSADIRTEGKWQQAGTSVEQNIDLESHRN